MNRRFSWYLKHLEIPCQVQCSLTPFGDSLLISTFPVDHYATAITLWRCQTQPNKSPLLCISIVTLTVLFVSATTCLWQTGQRGYMLYARVNVHKAVHGFAINCLTAVSIGSEFAVCILVAVSSAFCVLRNRFRNCTWL